MTTFASTASIGPFRRLLVVLVSLAALLLLAPVLLVLIPRSGS